MGKLIFKIENCLEDWNQLTNQTAIVLLKPLQIPPHIALITGNYFVHITVKKSEIIPLNRWNKLARQKNLQAIIFHLNNKNLLPIDISKISFNPIAKGKTCLEPVKLLFHQSHHTTIHDILKDLQNSRSIEMVSGFNICNNIYILPEYTIEDVRNHIESLKKGHLQST